MGSLGDALGRLMVPKDNRSTVDYAAENVQLFAPIVKEGLFNVSGSRHFIDPLVALDDMRTREVNILKPVRGGGSLIGDVHLYSTLPKERSPGPYMCVNQTDADAKMHFFDRTLRTFEGNPCLRELLPSRFEWTEIRLTNGHTLYTGGPGISNLQSKGIRYLRLDECWLYPLGRMAEAEARVGDYLVEHLSKILRISQAGVTDFRTLDECDWHRAWMNGERNEWEVACQYCGKYFEPVFNAAREDGSYWGLTWDRHKDASGDWSLARCCPTVRFECPHCKNPSVDSKKVKEEWNRTGRYRTITEENIKRRGFHWESVINYPWDELVTLWLDACNAERRGDLKPKLQFYQKRRAIFKDEESLLKTGMKVKRIPYEIRGKWEAEKERFLTIDRQEEDLLWWEVRAWSNEESRQLGFGKCYGFAAAEKIREDFKVQPNHTFCDSGYLPKGDNGVYLACIRYGWVATKGEDDFHFIHSAKRGGTIRKILKSYAPLSWGDPGMGTAEQGRKNCPLIRFSKPQFNEIVQRLHDAGRWIQSTAASPEMQREYSEQFGARVRMREFDPKTGKTKVWWKEAKNDHGRDLANMQAFGAVMCDLLPDPATERLTESEKNEDEQPTQT